MWYVYKVIKEDFGTGERGKRTRKYTSYEPLTIDGLYCHLGKGFKGCWRVLELVESGGETITQNLK